MRKVLLIVTILALSFTACKKKEISEELFKISAKTAPVVNNTQLTTIIIVGEQDLPKTLPQTYELTSPSSKPTLVAYEFKSEKEFELNVTTDANTQLFILSFKNSKGKLVNVPITKTNDWVTQGAR